MTTDVVVLCHAINNASDLTGAYDALQLLMAHLPVRMPHQHLGPRQSLNRRLEARQRASRLTPMAMQVHYLCQSIS